jgi:hypothetical protein
MSHPLLIETNVSLFACTEQKGKDFFKDQDSLTHLDESDASSLARSVPQFGQLTTIVCSPRDFDCRWPSRLGMLVTVIRMNSFNASHSDWNAVLTGISTLLQSMHQNISAVHFSVKWEWKSEDSQQRKVHWLHLLFTQNRKSCSHFALLIFRRQMEQLVSILEPAVICCQDCPLVTEVQDPICSKTIFLQVLRT